MSVSVGVSSSSSSSSSVSVVNVLSSVKPLLEGFLDKIGGSVKTWKTRYFRLTQDTLSYYESECSPLSKGSIFLPGSSLSVYSSSVFPDHPFSFGLTPMNESRQYLFSASSYSQRLTWLTALKPLCSVNLQAEKESLREGFLTKQGGTIKTWKKRWCVLTTTSFAYYKDVTQLTEPIDVLDLTAGVEVDREKGGKDGEWVFSVKPAAGSGRVYRFACLTEAEREGWVKTIKVLQQRYERK